MVEKVHQPAPRTVDRSGDTPAPGAPSKPGPARPTSGNANAPVKPLPDIKPDPKPGPKRALSSEIDAGLRDIRSGKFTAGETRIANGIKNVVMHLTGKNLRATYAEAKPATDEILVAYSRRLPADVMEVVDGVNNYLQGIVIDGFLLARVADSSQLKMALETAKKYVTDAGPDSHYPADRLESMISAMKDAGVGQPIRNSTRTACEEAIRSKP